MNLKPDRYNQDWPSKELIYLRIGIRKCSLKENSTETHLLVSRVCFIIHQMLSFVWDGLQQSRTQTFHGQAGVNSYSYAVGMIRELV